MALLFCDSFDHYNDISQKWTIGGGAIQLNNGNARTGIGCLVISGINAPVIGLPSSSGLIAGGAFNTQGLGFDAWNFGAGSGVKVSVQFDGSITLGDGSGTRATSAAGIFLAGAYQYLEVKVTYGAGNVGVATVRLNGISVPGLIAAPWNNNVAFFSEVFPRGPGAGLSCNIDDVYICDNTGSTNNDFLGAIRIYAVVPSSNGAPIQWTPSAGQNFQCVNSVPPGATFVQSDTPGNTDQYVYDVSAIPSLSTVVAAQHSLNTALSGAGTRQVGSSVNGIVTPGQAPSTAQHFLKFQYDINPATGVAWTLADFPSTVLGPSVTA